MELLKRIFGGRAAREAEIAEQTAIQQAAFEAEWEPIPGFVPASSEATTLVSVIAAALAAQHYPDSQFVVRRVMERNPKATTIAVIASAIAAGESSESQLVVKNIYQKRS